ncbi:MAG: hypothetical protein J1E06_11660 [Acutalibacter sp.]|nr:hypothetical protein [Acutalibacter sp.]
MTKKETSRAIAVIFDNSRSMYLDVYTNGETEDSMAWCQATYAIEVFAAMLNEGDVLQVYPMHDIEAGGGKYSMNNPLTIHGPEEASVVRDIFTPVAGGTPIESIEAAHIGLLQLQADERWLILLTDGTTFDREGKVIGSGSQEELTKATTKAVSEELKKCNSDVNVLYLGIGDMQVPDGKDSSSKNDYFGTKATSAQVPSALSDFCNKIFGRDELSSEYNPGGKHPSFDIDMSKLIVFIQGEDVGNISLMNSDGTVLSPSSSYFPQYSERGAIGVVKEEEWVLNCVDDSLTGAIATYENCSAGEYTLSYSGTDRSISIYYEPDVDLAVTITDESGAVMNSGDDFFPGTYDVHYSLVDRDGNETRSKLLGNVEYQLACAVNGAEPEQKESSEPGTMQITLNGGDSLELESSVTFLSGYQIHKDLQDLGWEGGQLSIIEDDTRAFSVDLKAPQSYYVVSKVAEGEPLRAELTMNGAPLTEEELARTTFSAESDTLKLIVEPIPGESAYSIRIDPEGTLDTGFHKISVSASSVDEVGREVTDSAESSVELQTYPLWLRVLLILLIIALLALLIWLFLNAKVLPKKVFIDNTRFTVDGANITGSANFSFAGGGKKRGSLEVTTPRYGANPLLRGGFRIEVEAVSPRRTPSKNRKMRVRSVSAVNTGAVNSIRVGASQFTKDLTTGKFVKTGGKAGAPVNFEISSGAPCSVSGEALAPDGGTMDFSLSARQRYK